MPRIFLWCGPRSDTAASRRVDGRRGLHSLPSQHGGRLRDGWRGLPCKQRVLRHPRDAGVCARGRPAVAIAADEPTSIISSERLRGVFTGDNLIDSLEPLVTRMLPIFTGTKRQRSSSRCLRVASVAIQLEAARERHQVPKNGCTRRPAESREQQECPVHWTINFVSASGWP